MSNTGSGDCRGLFPDRFRQLTIDFPSTEGGIKEKVTYNGIPAFKATFKAGLVSHVHRWFRLTPSFSPDLVREMLITLKCDSEDVILDPFAGAGTTIIEGQFEGLTCYGFEINPFLCFVGNTCLNWKLNTSNLRKLLDLISEQYNEMNHWVCFENLQGYGLSIPSIHNPTRWWRPDVLKQLLILRSCIDALACPSERNFFRLALAGVLIPDLTNVTLGRLQFHFIDRTYDEIQVLPTFVSHARKMITDLDELSGFEPKNESKIFLVDSTNLGNLRLDKPVRCVVTSPPYPNRYSYVWNTRPYLYFFDFFSTAKQASDLDKSTIGGTWGTATSILARGRISPVDGVVGEVVGEIVQRIRRVDNLMANYVMKYFNLLTKQIMEMDRLLTVDARLAYVVGCSRIKGVYIETDVLLGKIMEGLGYKISTIERIRRRNSGKDLHESIVYAWRK